MTKKLFATGAVALSLLTFVPATFAFGGFGGGFGQNEAVQTALENSDYSAFVEAVAAENSARFQNISEENFAKMVERHAEMAEHRAAAEEFRDSIAVAIATGDFDEWKNIVAEKNTDCPLLTKITADNFDEFVEAHEAGERFGVGRGGSAGGGKMGGEFGGKRGGGFGNGRHFQK